MCIVYLKPGREKSVQKRHPWIFSGAIAKVDGNPKIGRTVEIRNAQGNFEAWGAFSPNSQIRVRIWSWNPDAHIDSEFFHNRIWKAVEYRKWLFSHASGLLKSPNLETPTGLGLPSSVRLIHAESDGLPGLIIDRYGETLVVQFLSAGVDYWQDSIVDAIVDLPNIKCVYERSDADVRKLDGLQFRIGSLFGKLPDTLLVDENNLKFEVDPVGGHKTGFYLDQRINREIIRHFTGGKEVLDCFSYTGGFTVNALAGGADFVTCIDSSEDALDLARKNVKLNHFSEKRVNFLRADLFGQLRKFRDQARQFDMIILDPPKFAPTVSHVKKASRAYKDINLLALKLIRKDGLLVTFSCSGGVDIGLFQKIVAGAALDARVSAKILTRLEQSPDHPISLNFPEGAYLKGLILRVT